MPNQRFVSDSYFKAFGRPANKAEENYWMGQPDSDPRVQSLQSLIDNHRNWLKTNDGERKAMIKRSYQAVVNRSPKPGEMQHWDNVVRQSGYTFEELKSFHHEYKRNNPGWK